jgi:hypothetical protein
MDYDKAYILFGDIRSGIAEDSDLLEFIYEQQKIAYAEGYNDAKNFYETLIK